MQGSNKRKPATKSSKKEIHQYSVKSYKDSYCFVTTNEKGVEYKLTGHRYYPKDSISDSMTKSSIMNRDLEGQTWRLNSTYKGLYEIIYNSNDYGMLNWSLGIQYNPMENHNESLDVIISPKVISLFKVIQCENNFIQIKDALTDRYLNYDSSIKDENKRDSTSYFLTASRSEGSKWQMINLHWEEAEK